MAHKPKIDKSFAPSKATLRGISPQAITRRQIELESCSNPLKTREGIQFAIKKNLLSLGCLFFFNAYMVIGCLCYFLLTSAFLPDLPLTPWHPLGFSDFHKKKPAVFGCLTNALAPPLIALESCSTAQTDRPVQQIAREKKFFCLGGAGFL